jgi:isocitrate lyase
MNEDFPFKEHNTERTLKNFRSNIGQEGHIFDQMFSYYGCTTLPVVMLAELNSSDPYVIIE